MATANKNPICLKRINETKWMPERRKANSTTLLRLCSAPAGTHILHVGYKNSTPAGGRYDWFTFPGQYQDNYIDALTLAETLGLKGSDPVKAVIKYLQGWFIIVPMTHDEWNTLPTAPDPGVEVYRDGDCGSLVITPARNSQCDAIVTVRDPCDSSSASNVLLAPQKIDKLIAALTDGTDRQMEGDKGIGLNVFHEKGERIRLTVVGWGALVLSIDVPPRMIPAISNALRKAASKSALMH